MRKINKKCVICGKNYTIYCPTCREAINQPTWMNSFCSSNCRGIYDACASFNINAYTKEEAKALLDMCDLSNKKHFTPATQRLIDEIYSEYVVEENVKENDNLIEVSADSKDAVESKSLDDTNSPEEHAEISIDSKNIVMTAAHNTVKQVEKATSNKKKNKRK